MKTKPNPDHISWDECFMQMAHIIAKRSKDPSTQAGAIIVDPTNVIIGAGYNGWPRGIEDHNLCWNREGEYDQTKYPYVCHAEENAIYNANGSTKNCKLYCTLFPCNECAKSIIQTGIKEVIYENDKHNHLPAFQASIKLLKLAKVKTRKYEREQQ